MLPLPIGEDEAPPDATTSAGGHDSFDRYRDPLLRRRALAGIGPGLTPLLADLRLVTFPIVRPSIELAIACVALR
jgi:hypothetical protein